MIVTVILIVMIIVIVILIVIILQAHAAGEGAPYGIAKHIIS